MSEKREKSNGSAAGAEQAPCQPLDDFRFPGERIGHMRVASRPDSLKLVRALVNDAGGAIGCSGVCVTEMIMAVDEACQNIASPSICWILRLRSMSARSSRDRWMT
jgi:hypothetical protein